MSNMYHFTLGTTPHDIINLQLEKLCPEGYYHIYNLNSIDYTILFSAIQMADATKFVTEKNNTIYITNECMPAVLNCLFELCETNFCEEYFNRATDLRSAILSTLEIEEV